MDVYSYENISGTVLNIAPYTIPIGGDVVSNGSPVAELENYVGKGLRKWLNGVEQIQYIQRVPGTGELAADGKVLSNYTFEPYVGSIEIQSSVTTGDLSALLSSLYPSQENNAPWGRGREFIMPSRIVYTGLLQLSAMNSVRGGVRGCSLMRFDPATPLLIAGDYGHLTVQNDSLSKDGIESQAMIRHMAFNGSGDQITAAGVVVHGYYVAPGIGGRAHNIMDSSFDNYNGDGVRINGNTEDSMDQSCSWRMKCTKNKGWGAYYKDCSDMKHYSPGLGGNLLGALRLEHVATPYFFGFDMWNPNVGYLGTYTVEMWNQARAIFEVGTIAGRVLINGRNDQGTGVRYDATGIVFRNVDIKVDETLKTQYAATGGSGASYTSAIRCVDADDVLLDSVKFMFNDVTPTSTQIAQAPDYAIEVLTDAGDQTRVGYVRIKNAGGLVHKRGRTGSVAPIMPYLKHFSNRPDRIDFLDFIPTQALLVHDNFMNGTRLEYLGPGTYNKADLPFAYLIFTTGTLDDEETQFTIPAGPYAAPANHQWVYRVWP